MNTIAARPAVRLEREGAVARLVLDRPPLNILDTGTLHRFGDALDEAQADPRCKVLLLAGEGRAFCVGVDVADHTGERAGPMLDAFHAVVRRLLHFDRPVVAAVNGAALGGGCELLLGCDVVIAAEGAKLGQPEIRLGVFAPVAAALLPARIGAHAAADLLLSGRIIDAPEAHRLGLVSRVVPAGELAEAAREYAAALAGHSGPVMRLLLRALAAGAALPPDEALDRTESLYRHELMRLRDAHEGIAAFLEKRQPVWQEA